jgi:hypothetical protein
LEPTSFNILYVGTPSHNCRNSSTNDSIYTSKFSEVTESFSGICNANNIKKLLHAQPWREVIIE